MQIKIKLLSGENFVWSFEPTQSVAQVKEILAQKENIHPEQIILIFQGKILENALLLEQCNLQANA